MRHDFFRSKCGATSTQEWLLKESSEEPLEHVGITILNAHRIMAISTTRPDGWSQTTIVGYANAGFDLYFLVFRSSQKFQNIERDNRVSIAVGHEPKDLGQLQALYAGGYAEEVTDPKKRELAWSLLSERHPNLALFELPEASETAMMHASCEYLSVLDYTQGFGHTENLTRSAAHPQISGEARRDPWGAAAAAAEGEV
jgi:nitroimidazol reductase NimA-like FMN-containing flavoprotein (pyridoxamine 5'-phosphate oxidase superfamily)